MRITDSLRASRRGPLLQVVKSAVATALAWLVAGWLIPGPPPVFAAIAALLVVAPSLNQSLAKAVERSIGVVAGVIIASLLSLTLGTATWVVILATSIALIIAWGLRMTPVTANQVAISALLVLALGTSTPGYAGDRILETLIGAAIGIIVNLALVPPVLVGPARADADRLTEALAAALERLAVTLTEPQSGAQLTETMLEARLLRPMVDAAGAAIDAAGDSLAMNPRARRHRADLAVAQALVERHRAMVTQVIGMTRAVFDGYDPTLPDEPEAHAIAEQLRRAAHDVRLDPQRATAAAHAEGDEAAPADQEFSEETALTAPLTVPVPSPMHWILIGSLLEDLRRIHEALVEPPEVVSSGSRRRRR
ncbi:FUSC family protein [Microbacterium sp. BWT-B31]|uniref:FUSC family protein n=1 Tax=Microbacterium sp. BWT-B31 TaxID=3232072 RepID=UPI0035278A76